MTEPIVVRVNGLMTREDYEALRKIIKRESQNIIVLPPQSELIYPPNCGWIPITEQEPPAGHIIVTVLWEKGVDTAYDDDYEVFEEDWWAMDDSPLSQRIKARTIAWMPMPKPYRAERKEI